MIDQEIMTARLERIRANLTDLKELAKLPWDDFRANRQALAAAEHLLQVSIEAMLDIGNHIIAEKGFEPPAEYREIFITLGKRGIFSPDFTKRLINMTGLRNRLVHVYMEVDPEKIYQFIQDNLGDFEEFVRIALSLKD